MGHARQTTTKTVGQQRLTGHVELDQTAVGLRRLFFEPGFKNDLRRCDPLFDVSLPRFVVSDPSFGLFASQFHFLGYVIDPGGPVFLLVKPVTWGSLIVLVGGGPFCFYLFSGLDTTSLWHAAGSLLEFCACGFYTTNECFGIPQQRDPGQNHGIFMTV